MAQWINIYRSAAVHESIFFVVSKIWAYPPNASRCYGRGADEIIFRWISKLLKFCRVNYLHFHLGTVLL